MGQSDSKKYQIKNILIILINKYSSRNTAYRYKLYYLS